ncbi:hypothetical protein [Paludibaculum fermentans]|uniref:hypothetical protein n=1 Tax=Paludibaculum fermentans TaxID=1473598 RepID=UPI003EBD8673
MEETHLSDNDLERYVTGLIHHDAELVWIEQHLHSCAECVDRMENMQDSADHLQADPRSLLGDDDPSLR